MTPAEQQEATLIALWQQGLEIAVIAQRLGVPRGTVQSRAHRLQQRGLIQPRPRGGGYPRQRALARQNQTPVHSSADPPLEVMHPPVHTVHRVQAQLYALHGAVQQEVESPIDLRVLLSEALAPLLAQVTALEAEIKALRMHRCVYRRGLRSPATGLASDPFYTPGVSRQPASKAIRGLTRV